MLLLALDTATPAVTVALHDGSGVIAASVEVDARRHGELVAPSVRRVLRAAGATAGDLTDVAVGVGPGPFTGLRVGLVTARVLAAVTGARLVGVCTQDVLARAYADAAGAGAPGFAVATDARRSEVHWAAYEADGRRVEGPAVDRPAALAARLAPGTPIVGRGARLHADVLPVVDGPDDPDAGVLAAAVVAGALPLLAADPLYLRRPDATPPGPRKPVS